MANANYDQSVAKANELLFKYKITEPPVRIDEIIENEGLNVIEVDFGNESNEISGLINPDEKKIYVNQRESDNRQAFTIAHELGHWLLHKSKLTQDKEIGIMYRKSIVSLNNDPLEKEANCFAANLLVPFFLLEKYKHLGSASLSRLFGVSEDVIRFRLQQYDNGKA